MMGLGFLSPSTDGIYWESSYYFVDTDGAMAFEGGLFMGYDFGLFTAQVEFLFANDGGNMERWRYNPSYTYEQYDFSGALFQIPLIVKMDFHLRRFVLQPLGGFYLNFGLGDVYYTYSGSGYPSSGYIDGANPLFGWVAGGTVGFRLWRGFIFMDVRYMRSFGYTEIGGQEWFRRSATLFNFGYQYYFKSRKAK
jgi:hypothetical protein